MKKRRKLGNPGVRTPPGILRPRQVDMIPFCHARTVWWLAILSAVCLGVFPAQLVAGKEKKISRTVTGIVLDQAENPVTGATVVLTDLQTGKKFSVVSQEEGRYQFSDLQATHDYEVQATLKDLSSDARKVSSFDTRNRIVLNLKISSSKP